MDAFVVDPTRKFEIRKNGAVDVVQQQSVAATYTVANNLPIVAAVSGKRIRVMGWIVQTSHATIPGVWEVTNGAGFSRLDVGYPPTTAQPREFAPITDSGYYETSTGVGLYCNVSTQAVIATVFYIVYTP